MRLNAIMKKEIRVKIASRGGFTLIEVLIAVVILSTGIVVVLQALHSSLSALDCAVEKTRSAMLLQAKMGEAQAAARSGADPSTLGTSGRFEDPFERYLWQLNSASAPLSGMGSGGSEQSGGLFDVNATVWREGRQRTYSAATRVYVRPESDPSSGNAGGAL
jgi:prepilin-type N-terminal cleavage/methylation domain-containing protein